MAVILAPYRKGLGPRLKVDIDNGEMIAYPGKGERIVVFRWNPNDYRPGLSANTGVRQAEDLLGFVTAYVERPEEFDRSRWEVEQKNKSWWNRHGEAMLSEAMFRAEKGR